MELGLCEHMEEIVALRATLSSGEDRYFLTWGRLFDAVEPQGLIDAVRPHVTRMARGEVSTLEVCDSLQDASGEPYFYEGLFAFCQTPIPYGSHHEEWVSDMRERVTAGKEIYFLGVKQRDHAIE
jgi:hypothetical protein